MQDYVNQIRNLVSCPAKIYSQLYLTTLSQFFIHCPAELLKQRLIVTVIALKLRQGILLPKNAGAETIAAEEPQWTYALFSCALLKGLSSEAMRCIPKIAEEWLVKNNLLYHQWKDLLSNQFNTANDLYPIIQKAEMRSVNHDKSK